MQKIEVTGASDLASLLLTPRVFLYSISIDFLWVISVALYNNTYRVFEPLRVMRCNQSTEIKHLMGDIAVCIGKFQDDAEMDWHVYEIKLGTSTVSLSTVYCKFDLYVCIVFLQACVWYSSNATSHLLASCSRVNGFSRSSVEAYNTLSSYHSNQQ